MKNVGIDQNIISLFQEKSLDPEVAINWILGYIRTEQAQKINCLLPDLNNSVLTALPTSLIQEIRNTFPKLKLEETVHLLCQMSLLLGGGE